MSETLAGPPAAVPLETMLNLPLLLVVLAASDPAPPAATGPAVPPIRWTVDGISHALRVETTDGELALADRPHATLRSVVGPMVSTLHQQWWTADSGGYVTTKIVTEYEGSYEFDLIGWLDQSGQAGLALRQLAEGERWSLDGVNAIATAQGWPDRPQCPSPDGLARWDGGFVEMANLLVTAECVSDGAVGIEPDAFWVDAWDGKTVTLAVQREHCEAQRSACGGAFSRLKIRPPERWLPWLEDAVEGRGYVYAQGVRPGRPQTSWNPAGGPAPAERAAAAGPRAPVKLRGGQPGPQ